MTSDGVHTKTGAEGLQEGKVRHTNIQRSLRLKIHIVFSCVTSSCVLVDGKLSIGEVYCLPFQGIRH